ncbi:MAG: hypothetical protein HC804_04835 [Anaerolineae bacterium]|nr:hypothetical protein [Anaerolineae bacterium]
MQWHSDGYIEIVLNGTQTPEQIRELDRQARVIMEEHAALASLLIDARYGRIGRDATSFSVDYAPRP